MENKRDYSSVFEGIDKIREGDKEQIECLKKLVADQERELKKAKRYNTIMFILAVISLVLSIVMPIVLR